MSIRVLLVDDDAGFRKSATEALAERGYVVAGEAGSLAEARAAVGRLRPDALLLDVNLPDGNGVAFATELGASGDPPRILLTSSDSAAVTPRLLARCGAHGFVAKADLRTADLRGFLG